MHQKIQPPDWQTGLWIWARRWAYGGLILLAVAYVAAIAMITEGSTVIMKSLRWPVRVQDERMLAAQTKSQREVVSITVGDGLRLQGSLFAPLEGKAERVILLLHGIGDSRAGMLGFARMFRRHGYAVLAVDARGHGVSGDARVTFGIREADDVSAWVRFLQARFPGVGIYGMGESLGAAILLQALPRTPGLRAVVSECTYAEFSEIAVERLAGLMELPREVVRVGVVWPAFVYGRVRMGVWLADASPMAALREAKQPVLLIHGAEDSETSSVHSSRLWAARPAGSELWIVPKAGHVGASATAGEKFEERVVGWLRAR